MSENALKFSAFSSSVHPTFWSVFSKLKLEKLGLDESGVPCQGFFVNNDPEDLPGGTFSVDWKAFDKDDEEKSAIPWNTYEVGGTLWNKNTLESFKTCDKSAILAEESKKVLDFIRNGDLKQQSPERHLSRFTILMFADLKKYNFYYWFAYPALALENEKLKLNSLKALSEVIGDTGGVSSSYTTFKSRENNSAAFCAITNNEIVSLSEGIDKLNEGDQSVILAFADPSTMKDTPGWPLRNLLALLSVRATEAFRKGVKIAGLRQSKPPNVLENSVVFEVSYDGPVADATKSVVGWERTKGALRPKVANLQKSMDPKKLAESSVDLNLKLMKWRLVPELDLQKIADTKCLLLGSGTLGCNVARCLLGWGVRNITFVDNGKVSYSNPVRQSLFEFEDCLQGGKPKSEAAAEALKKVFPGVNAEHAVLSVPMAGHVIDSSDSVNVQRHFDQLRSLIQSHDVVFLLMDTRESRWLPTVIAAASGKLVINAALGFDSFMVMRHGIRNEKSYEGGVPDPGQPCISGEKLGCYFCNDIVAPGDSTKDRTLDQQCTVTRPGVSYLAASQAVELLMSMLQHPEVGRAAAACGNNKSTLPEGVLGTVPHSIRGSLSNFGQFSPTTALFESCSACSKPVLEAFKKDGFDFLKRVCNESNYLENLSGISKLIQDSNIESVLELSDFEDDDSE